MPVPHRRRWRWRPGRCPRGRWRWLPPARGLGGAVQSVGRGRRRGVAPPVSQHRRRRRRRCSESWVSACQAAVSPGQTLPLAAGPRTAPAGAFRARARPAQGCSYVHTAETSPAHSQYPHSSSAVAAARLLPQLTAHPQSDRGHPLHKRNPRAATNPHTRGFEGSSSTGSQDAACWCWEAPSAPAPRW